MTTDRRELCRWCAAEIDAAETICPACGRGLPEPPRPRRSRWLHILVAVVLIVGTAVVLAVGWVVLLVSGAGDRYAADHAAYCATAARDPRYGVDLSRLPGWKECGRGKLEGSIPGIGAATVDIGHGPVLETLTGLGVGLSSEPVVLVDRGLRFASPDRPALLDAAAAAEIRYRAGIVSSTTAHGAAARQVDALDAATRHQAAPSVNCQLCTYRTVLWIERDELWSAAITATDADDTTAAKARAFLTGPLLSVLTVPAAEAHCLSARSPGYSLPVAALPGWQPCGESSAIYRAAPELGGATVVRFDHIPIETLVRTPSVRVWQGADEATASSVPELLDAWAASWPAGRSSSTTIRGVPARQLDFAPNCRAAEVDTLYQNVWICSYRSVAWIEGNEFWIGRIAGPIADPVLVEGMRSFLSGPVLSALTIR